MTNSVISYLLMLVCSAALGLLVGCSGQKNYVVLLPMDGKVSGEVVVSNAHGSRVLNQSWQSTEISGPDVAPAQPIIQEQAAVHNQIGSALSAMPLPPVHFILYFESNTAKLTSASKRMLPEILKAVKDRQPAELSVVGHTDTVGSPKSNYQLGLLRAKMVTAQLTQVGVKPALVETDSHGESDLLIKTPDDTAEQRNRRVEVTIR